MSSRPYRKPRGKAKAAITLFPSNVQGGPIRNAITGTPTQFLVGSSEERRFWKVAKKDVERWGVGENGEPVQKTSGYDMATFFFDSPEQYERAYDIVLPQDIKESWALRNGVAADES